MTDSSMPCCRKRLSAFFFWLWLLFAATGGLALSALAAGLPFGIIALVATAFGLWSSGEAPLWVSLLLFALGIGLAPLWWYYGDVFAAG